jgi:hypothetical protein
VIGKCAVAIGVGRSEVAELDRINVYWAAMAARRPNCCVAPKQHLDAQRLKPLDLGQQQLIPALGASNVARAQFCP